MANKSFTFEISLSVLNHLGRQLYRSFGTVLGEAISNAWDADARNVRLYIDRENNSFVVKDDGDGMSADDFQNKFLKIGYSKRKGGRTRSNKKRPFIGRKGIGKLALLSSAKRITIISKVKGKPYVGGIIDNSGLDEAITNDLTPQEYPLGEPEMDLLRKYTVGHKKGTIIYFENINAGIKSSFAFLKKLIALYFRFSLLDKSFRIFLDDEEITHEQLSELAEKTQFLWTIGKQTDPYVRDLKSLFAKAKYEHEIKKIKVSGTKGVRGFVASVKKPKDLKIMTTDERIGVDLFVNGRLRERDILAHIPTARVVENYLYGQIHFDSLDDKTDRFTSSREGVVADDPKYTKFLEDLRKAILKIVDEWDTWRVKHRETGDAENPKLSDKTRASLGLYNAISNEYSPRDAKAKKIVDSWFNDLREDAAFNFESYGECFVSENLVRTYVLQKKLPLSPEAKKEAAKWRQVEKDSKGRGNISVVIRRVGSDLNYLAMDDLANLVDKPKDPLKDAGLGRDAKEYKPIRDAVAHTALLTQAAKDKLASIRENIKSRVQTLLSGAK
jgi:hypothetical protein